MRRLYIEYLGDSIEVPPGEMVVGRDVGCALRFNDPAVSRRHLRFIRRKDDEAFVEDLGSSNGTLLNGREVSTPLRIHDGDVISVGSRMLTVRLANEDSYLPTTVVLGASALEEPDEEPEEPAELARAPTRQIPRVTEPAEQRCPRCAAPVRDSDAKCSACNYRWRNFRPMSVTLDPDPLDRRRHDRISMELRLIYVSSELEIEATTLDLSHSGVFVRTQILDPVGTACQLTVLLDGGPALQVSGIVRRVVGQNDHGEPVGLGVELTGLGAAERAWIDVAVQRTVL